MGHHIFGIMQRKDKDGWTTFGTDDLVEYRHTDMFAVLGFISYQRGIDVRTLSNRLKAGWSIVDAVELPVGIRYDSFFLS